MTSKKATAACLAAVTLSLSTACTTVRETPSPAVPPPTEPPAASTPGAPPAEEPVTDLPAAVPLAEPPRPAHVLRADVEWSGEVVVEGDVLVPKGRTLRILPGTRVLLRAGDGEHDEPGFTHPGPEILVRGRLEAEGTQEQPVTFESSPVPADVSVQAPWGGITFDGGGGRLRHSRIVHAESAVVLIDASPDLVNVRIDQAGRGILVLGISRPAIRKAVVNALEEGLFCGPEASPAVTNSTFRSSSREALVAAPGCDADIGSTVLEGHAGGTLWGYRKERPAAADTLGDATVRPLRMRPSPLDLPYRELFDYGETSSPGSPDASRRGDELISSDETWSGTVVVDGRVTVAPEAVLVVEPGTTVLFDFRDADGDGVGESGLHVEGTLHAVGEPDRPILFIASNGRARGLWDALRLGGGGGRESALRYCVVESSHRGVDGVGANLRIGDSVFRENGRGVGLRTSRAVIMRSTFFSNGEGVAAFDSTAEISLSRLDRNGVAVLADYTDLFVNFCVVDNSRLGGIDVRYSNASLTGSFVRNNAPGIASMESDLEIDGLRVIRNSLHGFLLRDCDTTIIFTLIGSNAGNGLTAERSPVWIRGSIFLSNLRYTLENGSESTIDASGNLWVLDDRTVEELILDRHDDPALGPVKIYPIRQSATDYFGEEGQP